MAGAMLGDLGLENIVSKHETLLETLSMGAIIAADPDYIITSLLPRWEATRPCRNTLRKRMRVILRGPVSRPYKTAGSLYCRKTCFTTRQTHGEPIPVNICWICSIAACRRLDETLPSLPPPTRTDLSNVNARRNSITVMQYGQQIQPLLPVVNFRVERTCGSNAALQRFPFKQAA